MPSAAYHIPSQRAEMTSCSKGRPGRWCWYEHFYHLCLKRRALGLLKGRRPRDRDWPRCTSDELDSQVLNLLAGKGLISTPLDAQARCLHPHSPGCLWPCPLQRLCACCEECPTVEATLTVVVSCRARKGGSRVPGILRLWGAPQVSKPHLPECHH